MTMKLLTKILQALLGVAALIFTALVATGRLTLKGIRNWWRKRAKWLRRSIKVIASLILLVCLIEYGYDIYKENYGRSYWDDSTLSENIMIHSFNDETYRLYDCENDKYLTPKIDWVRYGSDSIAVYALNGKRGFLNRYTGEIIIDAEKNRYSKAWVFSEGVAAVMKDEMIGFIDPDNRIVIPFQYPKCDEEHFETDYLFNNGYCCMTNRDGRQGVIDKKGNWVVAPEYGMVYEPAGNGMRIVIKNGKYGVLDADMRLLYPTEYDDISIIGDGNGIVLAKEGRMWQVDDEGNVTNPFLFDCSYWLDCPEGYNEDGCISNGLSRYAKYEVKGCYGILDRFTGKALTLAIYSEINMLSPETFEVQDPHTYDWHVIDSNGKRTSQE